MRDEIFEVIFMKEKTNGKINYSKIAKQYDCDPRTVKRYFNARDDSPTIRKPREVKKVTDGYEDIITKKFIDDNAPAISIYKLLKDKYGYKGSYTSIKDFTHKIKEKKLHEITVRYETSPGLQCQIDWKESLKLTNRDGEQYVINIFLSILGFSRLKYIELTLDKTQPTLFKCLTNAIKYFKGVPKEFLFDNMKTVVDRSRTQYDKPSYNDTFYAFSKDAGFIPKSCLAFRPQTKGKVEVVAKIMNRLKAYNNEFCSIDDLKQIVKKLNEDVNNEVQQTTKEKPIERFLKEKEYLNPEPNYEALETYFLEKPISRKVPKDALIVFQNKKYSVSPKYIGKTVTISLKGSSLEINYNGSFVVSHNVSTKPINYLPEHYMELLKYSMNDTSLIETVCQNNLDLFDKL